MEAEKVGIVIPVSESLINQYAGTRTWFQQWLALPPEERRRQGEQFRLARLRKREQVRADQTVEVSDPAQAWDMFADRMGWPAGYLTHLVQPYCECGPGSSMAGEDGWEFCEHARDLWPDLG